MDRNDQQAIEGLFGKLAEVERQAPYRDAGANDFIHQQIARQPAAPYYMAQTIVVQEQALNAAQARIEELEQQAASRPAGGGLFSSLFGDNRQAARPAGAVPRVGAAPMQAPQMQQPFGQAQPMQRGGGFLAGAAQTAMGVAGGVLLGNAIAGMFGGSEAKASEPKAEEPAEDDGGNDAGFDDSELF